MSEVEKLKQEIASLVEEGVIDEDVLAILENCRTVEEIEGLLWVNSLKLSLKILGGRQS